MGTAQMAKVNDQFSKPGSETSSVSSGRMSPGLPLFNSAMIDHDKVRYPHCIVWTPIPCLTWLFPFIGHMGIATSMGVIRDFAGPYYVSEDCMGFGNPTKYWQLPLEKIPTGAQRELWDRSVYENSTNWNMIKLAFFMLIKGKYVSFGGFIKTWLPFLIMAAVIILVCVLTTQTVG